MRELTWRIVLVLLAFVGFAQPAAAGDAGTVTFRFDRVDYGASERVIYLPVAVDYATVQKAGGTAFQSFDATAMFRCATRSYALVDRRYFSGPQRSGTVVATTVEPPPDVRWQPVDADPQFARAFMRIRERCR